MSLLCKLIGHNFSFKRREDYTKNGEERFRVWLVQRNFCLRCGTPNPQMSTSVHEHVTQKKGAP